jgi:MFS family permease
LAETLQVTPKQTIWQERFPALMHPNYRLWFAGQVIAAFGMWMQATAQGYLIFELTQSPAYLGYVSFVGGVPTWMFMLYAGVVADRVPRRTLLLITNTCTMCLAFILAALTLTQLVQPWHILILAFLLGTVSAFDAPPRQAFTLEMVNREDLPNAIALNSTMFNTATAIGPAVAGFLYALVGPGWCFLLNGMSFTAIISALLIMKLQPLGRPLPRRSALLDIREGLSFAFRHPTLRVLLLLIGVTSLFGMSFATLIPAWAVRVLGGDATTNGLMQSARGLGALLGALWIASLGRFKYKGRLLTIGLLTMPATILIFSQVRWLPLSLLLLMATGLTIIPVVNLANALVQTLAPDELRGRIMSIYSLIFMGMWPLGGLWVGTLAQRYGETFPVVIGGCAVFVFAVFLYVRFPSIRDLE